MLRLPPVPTAGRVTMGARWYGDPMRLTIDSGGRIVLPKALRDRLGLSPGSTVDVSEYGGGLHLAPVSRTARLVEEDGQLVAVGTTEIDDDDVFALVDLGRR